MRRRLAAHSLYRKKLLEIRQLMGQQEFALAKQGTSYKLVGPRAHRTRLYELIEQLRRLERNSNQKILLQCKGLGKEPSGGQT